MFTFTCYLPVCRFGYGYWLRDFESIHPTLQERFAEGGYSHDFVNSQTTITAIIIISRFMQQFEIITIRTTN